MCPENVPLQVDQPAPAAEESESPSSVQPVLHEIEPEWEYRNQPRVVVYEALTARVGDRDALLWQPPALAFTAQAFLLTIALGHESSPIARLTAAFLGLGVTYLSIQLMLKHRMYLVNDMNSMIALERLMKVPTSALHHEIQVNFVKETDEVLGKNMKEKKYLTKFVSVHVWIYGLSVFGIINLVLMVFAALDIFGVPCAGWLGGETACRVAL